MSIILFLVILAALVFVHELGHFIAAKRAGIRVDEFAIGFPPRIASRRRGETRYSLGLIPFGGFVKIFGENPEDFKGSETPPRRSFTGAPRIVQAGVLAAGVAGNVVFAWLLISLAFTSGMPTPVGAYRGDTIANPRLIITNVLPHSPAESAGLRAGDTILSLSRGSASLAAPHVENAQRFIAEGGAPIILRYARGGAEGNVAVTPAKGIAAGKYAIGVGLEEIGTLTLPVHRALLEGAKTTAGLFVAVAAGLFHFIADAFRGAADFSSVTGPLGIAGLIGDAEALGIVHLLSFTAFISINLAVINLIPFPALDGGRILFVLIEALRRRAIPARLANALNMIGFAFLILVMIVVTYHDLARFL